MANPVGLYGPLAPPAVPIANPAVNLTDALNELVQRYNADIVFGGAAQNNPPSLSPSKLQIVANRGIMPSSSRQGTAGARFDTRLEARYNHVIGPQPVQGLRALIPGFIMSANGEKLLGNPVTTEMALEITSPATARYLFTQGSNLPTVPDGIPFLMTDPIDSIDFAAGAGFLLRKGFSVESPSMFIPSAVGGSASGDAGFISPSGVSQVNGTGSMSTPAGGTGFSVAIAGLVGIPAAPHTSVIFVGDSIPNGNNESAGGDTQGNYGFIARGLAGVGGFTVPYLGQTVGSWSLGNAGIDLSPRIRAYWPFCTHIIFQLGTNDIAANSSIPLATLQGYVNGLSQAAKRVVGPYGKPLKVTWTTLIPRTTSTDSWATPGGQTPIAGFTTGAIRDQYNTWLKSQAGTALIDYVVDVALAAEDQNNHGKWITNGSANFATTDGVHPNTNVHILMAAFINAWAGLISP